MSAPIRIIDRIRWRLGIIPDPLPHPKPAPTTSLPKPAAGMKAEKPLGTQSPIITHGLEHNPSVYGAIPLSQERIQIVQQEAKREAEAHEKEIQAPILSFQGRGAAIGTSLGGIGLTDQELLRRNTQWKMEQKALLADVSKINEILPSARGTVPIKTCHN